MLIALLLGSAHVLVAQKPSNYEGLSFTAKTDLILAKVKKDSLTTGKLYDRVVPLSNLFSLNDKDTISSDRFYQAISEIKRCSFDTTSATFAFKVYSSIRKLCRNTRVIYIGGYQTDVQYIDTNAIAGGLLEYDADSFLVSNPAKIGNPFKKKIIVISGILREDELNRNNYTIKYDPRFWFGFDNAPTSITLTLPSGVVTLQAGDSININLDLAFGASTRSPSVPIVITPPNPNPAPLTYNLEFHRTGRNQDEIDYINATQPCGNNLIIKGIPFDATAYPGGDISASIAELTFYYGNDVPNGELNCNRARVKKPVLLLDGFDPEDSRLAPEIYGKYLKYNLIS